jgi:hypothetical protein
MAIKSVEKEEIAFTMVEPQRYKSSNEKRRTWAGF